MSENNNIHLSTKACLDAIAYLSKIAMYKIHEALKKHSALNINGKEVNCRPVPSGISTGECYKEPYVWVNVICGKLDFSISTVWMEVNDDTNNIHHYFGQLNFVENVEGADEYKREPYSEKTTIEEIKKKSNEFQTFLNTHGYTTANQKREGVPFIVDNILNNTIKMADFIKVLDAWLVDKI
ncbi:MAG: hypothetical protein LBC73_09830 [Oscillospiraceae bacterium]|jgi:hypothetical protein|nr:hypothetical protein [Oscillospiraceae bacterium]